MCDSPVICNASLLAPHSAVTRETSDRKHSSTLPPWVFAQKAAAHSSGQVLSCRQQRHLRMGKQPGLLPACYHASVGLCCWRLAAAPC